MIAANKRPLAITILLTVASLVCLAVGLRLMSANAENIASPNYGAETQYVGALAIIGGVVIFLLGAMALLAARRYTVSTGRQAAPKTSDLHLVDIQQWGHDLEIIRDDMRREIGDSPAPEIQFQTLEIPSSWQPDGEYVLKDNGRPTDPLADLKHTRDQLLDAAQRVDDIVQSINESTAMCLAEVPNQQKVRFWQRWWK